VRAGAATIDAVSEACRAATGCGGCEPLVGKIVQSELDAQRPRLPVLHAAALVSV
jgi:NAD(P)H-nitrite reductase large subunit